LDEIHGPVSEKDLAFAETLDNLELYLTFFFLFDYMIHLYASENRTKYATQPLAVVDLITIVPSLVIVCLQIASSNDGERPSELDTASKLNFLRFVRVLKLLRVLRLLQTLKRNNQDQSSEITRQVALLKK
jgi:hypothetical protein